MKTETTVGDLKDGDIVVIGEESFRLMVNITDSWGCRMLMEDGGWSTSYTWFKMDVRIQRLVKEANPGKESRGGGRVEPIDPLMR